MHHTSEFEEYTIDGMNLVLDTPDELQSEYEQIEL